MGPLRKAAGIWGPATFGVAAVLAGRVQRGYSHRSHHVSGLAATGERSARVMVPGFLALGCSSLVMVAPDPAVTRLARIAGATTIAAGLIRVSDPSCPQPGRDPTATASDAGHGVASVATFVLWSAMPIVARRGRGAPWYRRTSVVLGVATAVGFGAAGITTQTRSPHKGLVQRAFLGAVFAWQMATALAVGHERGAGPSLGGPA